MNNIKFYIAYLFITSCLIITGLQCAAILKLHPSLFPIVFIQCINPFMGSLIMGLGIALPCFVLASVLGWVQFFLLIAGNVNPHLGREGLLKVLSTLFDKM